MVIQRILYTDDSRQHRLAKKISAMKHMEKIELIDNILMTAIAMDILNDTLLDTDDETLVMVLTGIWEDMEAFTARGIIIGEA